jgi:hypothetical protein
MHKKVYMGLLVVTAWFLHLSARAQDTAAAVAAAAPAGKPVEMADRLRADGKIYVPIAVLVTILLGLIAYVMRLDRKISRFEKSSK